MKNFLALLVNIFTRIFTFGAAYAIYAGINIFIFQESWEQILTGAEFSAYILIFSGVMLSLIAVWGVDRLILRYQHRGLYKSIVETLIDLLS